MDTLKKPKNTPKKRYNVKPKPMHYKVIKNLVENGGNKYRAIRDAGYSEAVATTPQKVTESKGFIQAMNEAGLSIETLNTYLASDLKAKPKQRFNELQLAYKLHGKLKENTLENKTLILITSGESATRYGVDKGVDN